MNEVNKLRALSVRISSNDAVEATPHPFRRGEAELPEEGLAEGRLAVGALAVGGLPPSLKSLYPL